MGALNSLATLGLNLALSEQAAKRQDKQLKADRNQRIQQIQLADAADRQARDAALKRQLAQQRARAGAAGVGTTGGSADAILAGLEAQSQAAQSQADAKTQNRIDGIRQSYGNRQRGNLLDFSGRALTATSRSLGGSGTGSRSLLG
jgi:hypothetical protein